MCGRQTGEGTATFKLHIWDVMLLAESSSSVKFWLQLHVARSPILARLPRDQQNPGGAHLQNQHTACHQHRLGREESLQIRAPAGHTKDMPQNSADLAKTGAGQLCFFRQGALQQRDNQVPPTGCGSDQLAPSSQASGCTLMR